MRESERERAARNSIAAPTGSPSETVRDILNAGGTAPYIMPRSSTEDLAQQRQTVRTAVQRKTHAAYEQVRLNFVAVPDDSPDTTPDKITPKVYTLLLKKEQAMCELWFGGQGSGFLPLLFPINIPNKEGNGTEEIGNWGHAEAVRPSMRKTILQNIRRRRHAAMLRNVDLVKAMTDSLADEDVATRGRAADAYTQALYQSKDILTEETRTEDLTSWLSEQQAFRANMYYMSQGDISDIREQYPLDTRVQSALLTVQELTEPTGNETEIVSLSTPPVGQRPGSVGTCNAPPAGKSLRIPPTPSVINSAWASEFFTEYDMAAQNNWFIPQVLLTVECNRSVQVLLEALKHVPSGVPWDTLMDFRSMLRKVIDSQKGNTAQCPKTAIQKICDLPVVLNRESIQNPDGPLATVQAVEKILTSHNPQPGKSPRPISGNPN